MSLFREEQSVGTKITNAFTRAKERVATRIQERRERRERMAVSTEEDTTAQAWKNSYHGCAPGPVPLVIFAVFASVSFLFTIGIFQNYRHCVNKPGKKHKHSKLSEDCSDYFAGAIFTFVLFCIFTISFAFQVRRNILRKRQSSAALETGFYDEDGEVRF